MKVKVFVKTAPMTKQEKYLHNIIDELHADLAAAEAENETLSETLEAALAAQEQTFQEKRDAERAQVCAERDLKALKTKFADACAERDNMTAAYKQLGATVIELQKKLHDNEERACDAYTELFDKSRLEREELESEIGDLRDELNDRNARVAELEQRIEWLDAEIKQGHAYVGALKDQAAIHAEEKAAFEDALRGFEETRQELEGELTRVRRAKNELIHEAEQWRIKYETEHQAYEADKAKADSICRSCDEVYQRTLKERDEYKEQAEKMEKRAAFNRHLFEVSESELKDRKEEVAALDRRVFELENSNDELRYKLEEAEQCIADQQRIIADAGETISNLRNGAKNPLPRTLSDLIMEALNEN